MAMMNHFKSQMLWDNIHKGDLTAVVNLLGNQAINLEERDENGQTFLMVACQEGEISMVRELLEAGIDPNAVDNDNWTALMYAAKEGHLEITIELLERGAELEHRDLCNWSALMWASYKGQETVVQELLDRGADPNIKAEHNMSCLCWAAGRGYTGVAKALLEKGARANSTDKYGTTALIWACRKGHLEIVQELLDHDASVDNTGMDSLTALLVATKGGYTEVVQALLEHDPNVNAIDKDGFTALTTAAKEGFEDIAQELLAKDAYVNVADRVGDTILIHAIKGGYTNIVRALLNRYADVDVEGSERKTALYWAVEKGHADVVKLLIDNDADMEISTKDGDTPLMRAVRNRLELIVRMLLDKGAKVSVFDKKGDSALHISLRARSKRITELLLRNPRNSRLLYRPNKTGETPYSIDAYHQKSILTQIHGHRQLNASDGENLLGYEIYSSSLADILSEPSLNTPITVGLYAKWGSGKSFLIEKLKHEMKAFTKANEESQLTFTWSLLIFLLLVNSFIGSVLALAVRWEVGVGVGLGMFVLEYGFLGLVWLCSSRYNMKVAGRISQAIGKRLHILSLLLKVLFCNPITRPQSDAEVPLVKFLFSEKTKLTSVGGEKALAAMVGGLGDSLEKEFGVISARLFGVFKPLSEKSHYGRFKTVCCIPLFVIVVFILLCLITGIALLVTHIDFKNKPVNVVMITLACIVGLSLLSNIHTFGRALVSLLIPQKSRMLRAADRLHHIKMDGFMQRLKYEVGLMTQIVRCMDKFTKNTTRLVVIVDGLDSCEQEKVLQVLDIIHALFNDDNSPFVVVLAIDPQIIIKGINQNLKSVFHDTSVNGFDYLRNIVHLPFYLQSQGLQVKRQDMTKSVSTGDVGHDSPTHSNRAYRHQDSTVSQISGLSVGDPTLKRTRSTKRQQQDSQAVVGHSNFDISNTLTKNDYFSDINPKSMRRLMNIVAVTGRLLRAYNIEFNWYRLAGWVNVVEQWPYRLSWIIMYFEDHDKLDADVTLKFIYNKIETQLPVSSEVEPLLEIDRNVRKFEAFLASKSSTTQMLNIGDLRKFLPCTINLDPYLRKLIRNLTSQQSMQPDMGLFTTPPGPTGVPSHGLQDPTQKTNAQGNFHRPHLKAPIAGMTPGHMMQYGQMRMMHPQMHPQMVGMHPYMMGMGYGPAPVPPMNVEAPVKTTPSVHPTQYIKDYNYEVLSKLTTAEISALLSRLEGINMNQLEVYQQAVEENNINGLVLSQCDLEALGGCLKMKFGDWQLFRSAILALREAEESGLAENAAVSPPVASGSERTRNNSERTIHFSNFDSVEPDENEGRDNKRRGTFTRQISVEQKEGSEGASGFEAIQEEEDEAKSPTGRVVRTKLGRNDSSSGLGRTDSSVGLGRNDSTVGLMMYESGLLHDFVHNFTENVSEDEDEDDEDDTGPETDTSSNNINRVNSSRGSALPVQFSLNSEHETHVDLALARLDSDENENHAAETEPLISQRSLAATSVASPTPILKMPRTLSLQTQQLAHSDPNLSSSKADKRRGKFSDTAPLVQDNSRSSSGFTADHSKHLSFRSDNNIEFVSMVDETKSDDHRNSVPSIQDSIHQFMLEDVSHKRAEHSAPQQQARGISETSLTYKPQLTGASSEAPRPMMASQSSVSSGLASSHSDLSREVQLITQKMKDTPDKSPVAYV